MSQSNQEPQNQPAQPGQTPGHQKESDVNQTSNPTTPKPIPVTVVPDPKSSTKR